MLKEWDGLEIVKEGWGELVGREGERADRGESFGFG